MLMLLFRVPKDEISIERERKDVRTVWVKAAALITLLRTFFKNWIILFLLLETICLLVSFSKKLNYS